LTIDPATRFPLREMRPYVSIPFAVMEHYRSNFEFNHGQTLEALRAQGGLDWIELWCGFTATPLFPTPPIGRDAARTFVLREVTRLTLGG
jgi:hypothetical protein